MRQFLRLVLIAVIFLIASSAFANGTRPLRVAVIGDTGIGDDSYNDSSARAIEDQTREGIKKGSYNKAFKLAIDTIKSLEPDVLLHAGDFIYLKKEKCFDNLEIIKKKLVGLSPHKLFAMGDNDVENSINKKKGYVSVGCWDRLVSMDDPFDLVPKGDPTPGMLEGFKKIDNVFFAVLDSNNWNDPKDWLAPRLKENGPEDWTIFVLHEPVLSVAWHNSDFESVENIRAVNRLKPDLVFSGHHHAYQRFFPTGLPRSDGSIPTTEGEIENKVAKFKHGDGTIHIVTGGGGAKLRPFANDQIGSRAELRTPPTGFREAVAKKEVMNHFVFLEITQKKIVGKTYRVCPNGKSGPRSRPTDDDMWKNTKLSCENSDHECSEITEEISVCDEFEIEKTNR